MGAAIKRGTSQNPFVTYYLDLMALCGRHGRKSFTIPIVCEYAMRAARFTSADRDKVLHAAADLMNATVACPFCHQRGPHKSNGAFLINKMSFTCKSCRSSFTVTEVQS